MRLHVYAAAAALLLTPLAASAQNAKPTDPQIAHIAYTAAHDSPHFRQPRKLC